MPEFEMFVSWSRSVSHEVAGVFKDWLPEVLPGVKAWMSSEDITKGTPWFASISDQLSRSGACLICVTVALVTTGSIPIYAVVLIGFFHSIMVPTDEARITDHIFEVEIWSEEVIGTGVFMGTLDISLALLERRPAGQAWLLLICLTVAACER